MQENDFQNVICKTVAILFRPDCAKVAQTQIQEVVQYEYTVLS